MKHFLSDKVAESLARENGMTMNGIHAIADLCRKRYGEIKDIELNLECVLDDFYYGEEKTSIWWWNGVEGKLAEDVLYKKDYVDFV